ncbi:hypothetical protein TNCT_671281 [Trichonephila clavata]|uniref:Uncharacterized protein n=1 Tax=Trichonephila clavata TaxID=2740835 RepID=A0A8X6FDJ0_TRICU|nr:hypothetical protein TNCT_671281 [Trichonephila clavata]
MSKSILNLAKFHLKVCKSIRRGGRGVNLHNNIYIIRWDRHHYGKPPERLGSSVSCNGSTDLSVQPRDTFNIPAERYSVIFYLSNGDIEWAILLGQ